MASITVPHALVGDSAPEAHPLVNDHDLEVMFLFSVVSFYTWVCSFVSISENHSGAMVFFLAGLSGS